MTAPERDRRSANEDEVNLPNDVALRAVLTGSGPSFPAG